MSAGKGSRYNRRQFLRTAGSAATLGGIRGGAAARGVSIVALAGDPVASSAPVKWACEELRQALAARQAPVRLCESVAQSGAGDLCILVAGGRAAPARSILGASNASLPDVPESLALAPGKSGGKPVVLASGSDVRGAVYGVLELADRARLSADPVAALVVRQPVVERPANAIRSIARCFESDVEDKSWFHDRDLWRAYLSMLAAQRFNRFSLTFGLGYNFPRNVRDVYFYFAYPYLLSVPGYQVRVSNLPDAERDRNLETLRFISEETAARGLHFQLALWTHAYQWVDSPNANATIEGLTPETHAPYCRDALHALLQACPSIRGVTFRIHGESGVPEGSYSFWETLFQGIVRTGRKIEIDMHAKGMDQKMIGVALATGMPINVSPKYWAEHMGLPYHQAAIRELEMARESRTEGPFTLSAGSRSFLRYGWGDLLTEQRAYGVLHRIWPGTQRVLLWGDPAMAAGYGRCANFCGTQGVELCEPLSFKGRMGSGRPGGRCAYADGSLNPRYDWEKYLYTYRVWGRSIYNPDTDPEGWRRYLRRELASAAELLSGERAAKYSPLDWAQWLEDSSSAAARYLKEMEAESGGHRNATHRRIAADVAIQAGLARFFADKLRSAVLWALYQKSLDPAAREAALKAYRSARSAWAEMANAAQAVYAADVTYGTAPHLRGHWLDRLPAIDGDIADMEKWEPETRDGGTRVPAAVREALARPQHPPPACRHTPPRRFRAGEPLAVELSVETGNGRSIRLHYRRVNQAERWRSAEMQGRDNRYAAVIPADYTQSPYALEYYFELRDAGNAPHLYPGFQPDLANQPYFLVRQV